jgi:Tol biopolymer transport system component
VFQIADGENYDIGLTQVSTTAPAFAVLAGSHAYDGSYTWSPDGQHVAFISARDGFEGVYVANADSHVVVRLTGSASLTPAWGSQR